MIKFVVALDDLLELCYTFILQISKILLLLERGYISFTDCVINVCCRGLYELLAAGSIPIIVINLIALFAIVIFFKYH